MTEVLFPFAAGAEAASRVTLQFAAHGTPPVLQDVAPQVTPQVARPSAAARILKERRP